MSLRFDSIVMPKVTKTPEGYLRGEVVVSRAGVFEYINSDNSIRGELRHPDEIFEKDSLDTLKMIPMTNDHPPEFVDATNSHKYMVGYTGERYDIDEDKILVSFTVTNQDAIEAVNKGKVELSLGYETDLVQEEGIYEKKKYDFRQLKPIYNHLAIVNKARAGHEARFRFDSSAELIKPITPYINTKEKEDTLMDENSKLRIDALASEKNELIAKLEKQDAHLQLEKSNTKNLEKKIDHLEKSLDKIRKDLAREKEVKSDEIIAKQVMDRVSLFSYSAPYLKDIEAYLYHTDREIMEAAMNSRRTDKLDYKDKSDEYIRGVFESFVGVNPRSDGERKAVFSVIKKHNDLSIESTEHDHFVKLMKKDWIEQKARRNNAR